MSELLQELVGKEVTVWTILGSSHISTLQDVGVRWIGLNGGTLLIQTDNIRLIKIAGGAMTAQAAAGEFNPSMIGRNLSITTKALESGFCDTGTLEAFDEGWLRIRKKNDQLYFPISSIVALRLLSE